MFNPHCNFGRLLTLERASLISTHVKFYYHVGQNEFRDPDKMMILHLFALNCTLGVAVGKLFVKEKWLEAILTPAKVRNVSLEKSLAKKLSKGPLRIDTVSILYMLPYV